MNLPPEFLSRPLAHRGLHDRDNGVIENSTTAFRNAIEHGYGIELDLQLSFDKQAMVFHDYDLGRLTAQTGAIGQMPSDDLRKTALTGGDDTIQPLREILDLVAGRVPLLIELKDQDGAMGPDIGPLERSVADALAHYRGPAAVMSFNPHSIAKMAELLPVVPRGLVTSAYDRENWPLPEATCDHLRQIADFDRVGACFIRMRQAISGGRA